MHRGLVEEAQIGAEALLVPPTGLPDKQTIPRSVAKSQGERGFRGWLLSAQLITAQQSVSCDLKLDDQPLDVQPGYWASRLMLRNNPALALSHRARFRFARRLLT